MKKNFLFGLLALMLAGAGFGGISMACEGSEFEITVEGVDGTNSLCTTKGKLTKTQLKTCDGGTYFLGSNYDTEITTSYVFKENSTIKCNKTTKSISVHFADGSTKTYNTDTDFTISHTDITDCKGTLFIGDAFDVNTLDKSKHIQKDYKVDNEGMNFICNTKYVAKYDGKLYESFENVVNEANGNEFTVLLKPSNYTLNVGQVLKYTAPTGNSPIIEKPEGFSINTETTKETINNVNWTTYTKTLSDPLLTITNGDNVKYLGDFNFQSLNENGTFKFNDNITVNDEMYLMNSAKDITLDLNGKSLTSQLANSKEKTLWLEKNGAKFSIIDTSEGKNGKITSNGVILLGVSDKPISDVTLDVDGTVETTYDLAIATNGKGISNSKINVKSNGSVSTESPNGVALYLAGKDGIESTIDGKLEGGTALEIRAGKLTINENAKLTGKGTFSKNANPSGTTIQGAALAISQHVTNLPIEIIINGGTFEGEYALYEEDLQDEEAVNDISIVVENGNFKGKIYSENIENFIKGGKFSEKPDDKYIADGFVLKEIEGSEYKYEIEKKTYTVLWKLGENVLETDENVAHESTPTYDGATPTKSADSSYTYSFKGWSKDGTDTTVTLADEKITSDVTYTAVFNQTSKPTYSGGGGSSRSSSKTTTTDDTKKAEDTKAEETKADETKTDESKTEENKVDGNNNDSVAPATFSQEFIDAYNFAYKNGITTMPTINEAQMDQPLTRIAMAKMLSQYAINVLGKTPDTTIEVPNFPDVSEELDAQYNNGVTLAYQLGIMGINVEKFRPNDLVTRAEFGTALSRMLYGLADGEGNEWYKTHLDKLMEEKIITVDTPNLKELRGYVMIMLMRSANRNSQS